MIHISNIQGLTKKNITWYFEVHAYFLMSPLFILFNQTQSRSILILSIKYRTESFGSQNLKRFLLNQMAPKGSVMLFQ
jgi:hypothetical protein